MPEHRRDENRTYSRKPGGGRKRIPPRRVLEGIFYVLRTGIQWKALP
ncbi:MAG: transposase, partial [Treponema sp.]|nr:transposase [Treponema sp.]